MQKLSEFVTVNEHIQFGKPVFKGTRVPVQSLFWHLEKNITLQQFLEDFPSASKSQAEAVIACGARHFEHPKFCLMKLLLDENL